ncbi:MAG TPA: response regulator [Nitrospirae bacterium]|nr:response regulator [Nitrospirota bacterium]
MVLASCPGDAVSKEDLISKAQEALLQAKIKGKNRIECFETEKEIVDDGKPKILVVDDEPNNLKLLEALLVPLNYEVIKASGGEEALLIVNRTDIDMVLLDIMMPGMNGYEVCRRLKGNENTRLVPIVMVTALNDMDAKIKGIEAGVDDFITKPPNKLELLTRIKNLIRVKALNNSLTNLKSVLFSLANAVEAKDEYTKGHVCRVSDTAAALCKKIGMSERSIKAVKLAGIIHDIGKIGVPEDILNKPGPLTPGERAVMKKHAYIGYKICLPLKRTLGSALDIIRYHHEKLDGSGFPDGLKGEEISIEARVMAVVDIYDALVSDRPYRKAISKREALDILLREADEGKLDKRIVEYLIEMMVE